MSKIFGIGTDIVEVKRFEEKPYQENVDFYKKIFLSSEIKYCLKFKFPAEHFAGKFAIKESTKKAISENIEFLDIETYHDKQKPKIRVISENSNNYYFMCSISHEKNYAIGFVVAFCD